MVVGYHDFRKPPYRGHGHPWTSQYPLQSERQSEHPGFPKRLRRWNYRLGPRVRSNLGELEDHPSCRSVHRETVRIPIWEDWGTLGKTRGITTPHRSAWRIISVKWRKNGESHKIRIRPKNHLNFFSSQPGRAC